MADTKTVELAERQTALETQIRELHARIAKSIFAIGKLLVQLRDEIVPRGEWRRYIEDNAAERFGFSPATAWRYVEQYEEATKIPETRRAALEAAGLDPAKPKVLAAVANVRETLPGKMKPVEFATAVQERVQAPMRKARARREAPEAKTPEGRIRGRRAKLYDFVHALYADVALGVIQADFQVVLDRLATEREATAA